MKKGTDYSVPTRKTYDFNVRAWEWTERSVPFFNKLLGVHEQSKAPVSGAGCRNLLIYGFWGTSPNPTA